MNGYQRIEAAVKGEKTDKVPIMLHNFMMVAKEAGISMNQYRNDPKLIANAFIRSVEKYQYDGVLVDIDTVCLAGAVGVPVDFPQDEPARTKQGILEQVADIQSYKSFKVADYKYIQVWLEAVRLLVDYFKKEIYVRGNCDQAPFSLASMMRGAQNWMMDLYMVDEALLMELLSYCTEAGKEFISLMAETGADMISNGDSPAGPEMIPPELYLKYAMPFEKELVDHSHKLGLPYVLHICGDTSKILDEMAMTGADGIELDYKTDVNSVFEKYKDSVCFFGNVDPSGVLALGTPDDVRKVTLELLKLYDSNRFVLNAGCALPAETPANNIETFIHTARSFR